MAKLLCSSLLRGFWSGEIRVFRNFETPLFPVERKGLEEVQVTTSDFGDGPEAGRQCLQEALAARFLAAEWIERPEDYDWIIYLDADCLALRDVEHLFAGEADVLVQPEVGRSMVAEAVFNGYLGDPPPRSARNGWLGRDGINAGTFAVRGSVFRQVMAEWRRIHGSEPERHAEFRDQTAFNRLLLETELRVRPFERGEVMFPFHLDPGFLRYREAALLHFVGGKQKDKIDLAFALHMMRVYGDEGGLFLDLLES
jgi:hypothetical protein